MGKTEIQVEGGDKRMGKTYVKIENTSFPVPGKEAVEYERLGQGLVRENDRKYGPDAETAIDRLLESHLTREFNK